VRRKCHNAGKMKKNARERGKLFSQFSQKSHFVWLPQQQDQQRRVYEYIRGRSQPWRSTDRPEVAPAQGIGANPASLLLPVVNRALEPVKNVTGPRVLIVLEGQLFVLFSRI